VTALLVVVATAAAAVALFVNVILLGDATTRHDPVGRLSPSSMIVHAPGRQGVQVPPRSQRELPDD